MQIVIDIPEEEYRCVQITGCIGNETCVSNAIYNGIPLDEVIEGIKADIADFMSEIPTIGNCKEGWHNSGQRIGLEQACEIIDNHISGKESEGKG